MSLSDPMKKLSHRLLKLEIRAVALDAVIKGYESIIRAASREMSRRGIEQGYVDPALDVDVVVRMLMALGDGIVAHRVIADFMTDDRTEAVLETMLERFLRPHAASLKAFIDPVSSQLAVTPLPTSA